LERSILSISLVEQIVGVALAVLFVAVLLVAVVFKEVVAAEPWRVGSATTTLKAKQSKMATARISADGSMLRSF
jgi:hypothetical protein